MAQDHGDGMFDMAFITQMDAEKDLSKLKAMVIKQIESSSAKPANKSNALSMVSKCRTVKSLMIGVNSFYMSHRGLKVIR